MCDLLPLIERWAVYRAAYGGVINANAGHSQVELVKLLLERCFGNIGHLCRAETLAAVQANKTAARRGEALRIKSGRLRRQRALC